ncbi:MAG: T9SS type A sorting domain-containing protein [Bacteroidia bacterium]|nr:T9SS type A sorting domain-containing protein [Bacteroidia bacterium]
MKKTFFIALFSVCLFGTITAQQFQDMISDGDYTVSEIVSEAESYFDVVGRERGTGYKPFRRWQYFAEREMFENGKTKSPEYYFNELQNYNANVNANDGSLARTTVGNWESLGPTYWNGTSGWNPGVGRITSVDVDLTDTNHIIVGSQTGGVWKTTNGGATWTVLTDNLSNIDVYALAIDPIDINTYYWGSYSGIVFKSIDAGATWNLFTTLPQGGTVNKILIHPTNTDIMFCSAQGVGLFSTFNGGQSWTNIMPSETTGYDFEFKPGDPNVVYASGNGFYRSDNGGLTFTQVFSSFSNGPKMIGVSPASPITVYVVESSNGTFNGFYKSTTDGLLFNKLSHTGKNYFGYSSTADDNLGQAPRDMDIVVSPTNIDEVHIAGINTWRSTDGGSLFSITSQWTPGGASAANIGYCHADVDIMKFIGNKLYVGTDGGLFVADNTLIVSNTYYTDLTAGLGIRQFYRLGISQTDPVVVTAGSQDNGTSTLAADGNWRDWLGADGMEGFVDKNNSQLLYGTSQFGSMYKSSDGGTSYTSVTQPDGKGGSSGWNWITPILQDPIDDNVIYAAFDEVYKSADGGSTWNSISQNFAANIDHLKIAPTDNTIMYMAINGVFLGSIDGGANWFQSSLDLAGSIINDIAVHPTTPSKVAIVGSGGQKVFVSSNYGLNWVEYTYDLPGFSAQAIVWHDNGKDGLYVGMNYGIYYLDNTTLNSWQPFNNGLPNVRINELEVNLVDGKLYAATYGRGLWRSDLYDASLSVNEFEVANFRVYPNPTTDNMTLKYQNSEPTTVRIFDAAGKLLHYKKDAELSIGYNIDLSSYNSGIYFVRLNNTLGQITKKVIKK